MAIVDDELYTLKTAGQTYRVFIKMAEGAVTLNREGIILTTIRSLLLSMKRPYQSHQFYSPLFRPIAVMCLIFFLTEDGKKIAKVKWY